MLESTGNKVSYILADNPVFTFPYRFFQPEDIHCYILDESGVEKTLLINQDFSVENKSDYSSGANITLVTSGTPNLPSGIPAGAVLTICRELSFTQTLSLPNLGKLPSSSMEKTLDSIVMMIQQLAEALSRCYMISHGMDWEDNPDDIASLDRKINTVNTKLNELENFVNSSLTNEKIRELANTRCWTCELVTIVPGTEVSFLHGLGISAIISRVVAMVNLKCVNPSGADGYLVGEYAPAVLKSNPDDNGFSGYCPIIPQLTATQVKCQTPAAGVWLLNHTSGKLVQANPENWKYEFRIYY